MTATDDRAKAEALIRDLEGLGEAKCRGCGGNLGPHAYVASVALGFKDRPRCAGCLAEAHGRDRKAFLEHVAYYIQTRACFRAGWEWADRRLGHGGSRQPGARWVEEECMAASQGGGSEPDAGVRATGGTFDAGDMGCGDLVLELRARVRALAPGQVLEVIAKDPGAPEDVPAWCGLTGHRLVAARPPRYWIERKREEK